MADPVAKAKSVLKTKTVGEIPALSLKAVAESEGVKYLLNLIPGVGMVYLPSKENNVPFL